MNISGKKNILKYKILANWVLLVPFLYRFMKCSYEELKGKNIERADGPISRPVQVQVRRPHCDKTLSSLTRLKDHIKNIHETNKTFGICRSYLFCEYS